MNNIETKLAEIKDQTGLHLDLCDHFTGIRTHKGKKHFNVILKDPIFISTEYTKLEKLSAKGVISEVKPAGYKRVSIYF